MLAIRRAARRWRRHGPALFAVIVICGAVAAHHSSVPMGDMHHGDGVRDAVELCLGVFVAIGGAVALAVFGLLPLRRPRPPRALSPLGIGGALAVAEPRARAGPVVLSLLCVRRR